MRTAVAIVVFLQLAPACADDLYHNVPSEELAWPFTTEIPACDDGSVLRKLMYDFEKREREFWASTLSISEYHSIKEIGFRSNGSSYTPRRYCKAEALFSDGLKRDVFFNLTPEHSVILSGPVMDWCVVGLDRAHVDGENCRRVANLTR